MRKVKWTAAATKQLLRRIEPRLSTASLVELRELLTKQLIRHRFVSWKWETSRIASSLGITEAAVIETLRDVARKARV